MEDYRMNNCWLSIDKNHGSLDTTLNLFFDENNTGANRSAKIRVSSKEGDIIKEYTIVQKKRDAVVYKNVQKSESFTKNDCNDETERGETLEYVVPAGKYTSLISQEDADQKALDDIAANGQNWVNQNSVCITSLWYNKEQSKEFQKNDCDPDTEEGSKVIFTIPANSYTSTISQADADQKAVDELNSGGQDYANSHGECITIKWYNVEMKQSFQKNDCLGTETGSMVEYVVPAKKYSSNISQEDADNKAKAEIEANGQDYANENGTCETNLWYNKEQRRTFTKNDCEEGYIGTEYEYIVEAGRYSSEISQEDADQKALDDIEANGQAQANLNGTCENDPNYFVGVASKVFTRNNCDPDKYGTDVTVTQDDVTGGPFISHVSQDEADALAMAAVDAQGQDIANQRGECLDKQVFTGVYSKEFTKNDCADGGTGSIVTVTQDDVTGGPFTSTESQEVANALAQAAVEAQGQEIANTRGNCTWTGTYSKEFQKNDCEEGQEGSMVTVTQYDVTGGPFTSTVSQEDANSKAQAAVESQGQAIANSRGNCEDQTVYTGHYSARFTPECERCHEGVEIEVTAEMVNGSPVTSTISQDDADSKARQIVEEGGQAYANKNGTCNPMSTDPVWEDVVPEELRCNEGKSEKKQHDTNECSSSYNEERWVEGGDKTCQWTGVYSETFKRNDCEVADSGTEVEVTQDMCDGAPFISFVSQDDANSLAEAAVKEQGQGIANEQGSCQFVGVYSAQFTKDNCGTCQHGIEITVNQDMVGGPFYSLISQEDANSKAQAAVEEQGQAYANKNGDCELDSTDPQWEDTGETRCQDGVSQKEQIDKNPCSPTHNQTQWVEGGGLTCTWTGSYSKEFTKQCADGGTGSKVTVTQDDVTGGPFTSTVSQEDANSKAQAAVEAQGQAIADSNGTCEWIGECTKQFTKNDCGTCKHGSSVNVNQDMVGGPFRSNVSKADADAKACAAVDEQGQAAANKNGSCVADDSTPNWVDTGSTQCSGCNSQKQQRDTNQCSNTYNQTKWVSGGSRDCSENGSWGSWSGSCSRCTYERRRTNSCGGVETDYEYNSGNCGSWGGCSFSYCDGEYSVYEEEHSCTGSTRQCRRELVDGQCGYTECDPNKWSNVGSAHCRSGKSQIQQRNECGGTRWIDYGTACTATYDCSNYTSSGSSPCNWTCKGSGTQTGSGSTTTEAQNNAKAKCSCSSYTATYHCSMSGSEGDCSYIGTEADVTGSGSSASAACTNAQSKCQRMYSYTSSRAATDAECKAKCGGTSNNAKLKATGLGNTCEAAKADFPSEWDTMFDRNFSQYCNCGSWSASVSSSSGSSYTVSYSNPCGSSQTAVFSVDYTHSGSTQMITDPVHVTIPSGSGTLSKSVTVSGNVRSVYGSDGGSC